MRAGKRVGGNARRCFQGDGALDGVLEFADVAGPVVNFQAAHGFRLDGFDLLAHGFGIAIQERAREQRDIFAAFAQGRQVDGNHAEAVVKILAEAAFGDFLGEIFVGGGDDADIHIAFFGAAERADFSFLQDAVELHLHGEAHVADLVHEERAAVGGLKQAAAIFVCAGEGAAQVAEEFGFEQGFGKRAAIDGDEGRFGARAIFVDGAGDEFLAGAAFSGDQHAAGLRSDGFDQVEEIAHFGAGADDVIEAGEAAELAAQFAGFLAQSLIFGDALDGGAKLVEQAIALDDVAVGAEIHGVNGGVDRGHAGNQDEDRGGRDFLGIPQKLDAVHIRHADIGDDDVENLRGEAALGGLAVGDNFDFVAFLAEADFQQFADGGFVVNDEQVGHGALPLPYYAQVLVTFAGLLQFGRSGAGAHGARNFDDEIRASALLGFDANASAMRLQNLIHDGQAQSRAAGKSGLKRLEDARGLRGVKADAGVANLDLRPVFVGARC